MFEQWRWQVVDYQGTIHEHAVCLIQDELVARGFSVTRHDRSWLIACRHAPEYEIRVHGVTTLNYWYIPKCRLAPAPHRLLALVMELPVDGRRLYLIPSQSLVQPQPSLGVVLKDREHIGGKSDPEYGILPGRRGALGLLDAAFGFDRVVATL